MIRREDGASLMAGLIKGGTVLSGYLFKPAVTRVSRDSLDKLNQLRYMKTSCYCRKTEVPLRVPGLNFTIIGITISGFHLKYPSVWEKHTGWASGHYLDWFSVRFRSGKDFSVGSGQYLEEYLFDS